MCVISVCLHGRCYVETRGGAVACSFISKCHHQIVSDFAAEMHEIQFRLWRHRELTAMQDSAAGFWAEKLRKGKIREER